MDKTLYYGDAIVLYNENLKGYLYARGFINKALLFNSSIPKTESHFVVLPKIINMEAMEDERFKGNPNLLLFGSQFCLKHVDSGYFLAGSSEPIESLSGFRLCMSERFTKDCVFKLQPLTTFLHEGDLVYSNSLFVIKHPKMRCFINIEQDVQAPLSRDVNPITASNSHIFTETETLRACKLSYEKSCRWQFALRTPDQLTGKRYLQPNDYIYLVHSEDNSIVSVDSTNNITFKLRDYNHSEIYKALWEVEYSYDRKTREDELRLRHVLTGLYFNTVLSKAPVRIVLRPIIQTENRLPPFDIYIKDVKDECKFTKLNSRENERLHGFQVNKAQKTYIKEILSIKGMHPAIWIPYLIEFLKTDTRVKQSLLREFGIIDTVILIVRRKSWDHPEICYNLLYDVCKGNIRNKKKICESIDLILNEPNKFYSQQLLTELLSENYEQTDDVIERQMKPERIEGFLREFIQLKNMYDIQYMRILRAFTGTYRKANVRNQNFIFQIFFYLGESKVDMTRSKIAYLPKLSVPIDMKCRLVRSLSGVQIVHFENKEQKTSSIEDLPQAKRQFFRQYFYLLGDCIKNRNQRNIEQFRKELELPILCDVLRDERFSTFWGPILNLIKSAYIDFKPYYRCQLYFLNGESELTFSGQLLSILPKDSELFFVLSFLKDQIPKVQHYFESYTLILMETLKLTIQFGFWNDMGQLLEIRKTLERMIFFSADRIRQRESQGETRRKGNNLVLSKILAVEIYRLLLNLQLNLWVSDLLTLPESAITQRVQRWLESDSSQWRLDSRFFALASEKDSQLMKNSLNLFYRLFNIKKQLFQMLKEARRDELASQQPKSPQRLRRQNDDKQFAKMCTKDSLSGIDIFNKLIGYLVGSYRPMQGVDFNFNEKFDSLFNKGQINKYFQMLSVKFGLHLRIIDELVKINPDSIRSKLFGLLCMDFYLLIAIIQDNMANKKVVSRYRKDLTKFLRTKDVSGLCIQFIEQLYHNNKHLITDYKEVENLSQSILRSMLNARGEGRLYECCKHLTVLHELTTLQNKELQSNQSIILFQIFKKDFAPILEPALLRSEDNAEAVALYNIIMYALMNSLGQQVKNKFLICYRFDVLNEMLERYPFNWLLKSKVRLYINQTYLKPQPQPQPKSQERSSVSIQGSPTKECHRDEEGNIDLATLMTDWQQDEIETKLLQSCHSDLAIALRALLSERSTERWQMFEFQRNLRQIISTFKKILIRLNRSTMINQANDRKRRLMLEVSKQLEGIKDYCSVDVLVEIESLRQCFNSLREKQQSEASLSSQSILDKGDELDSASRRRSLPEDKLNRFLRCAGSSSATVYSHDHITHIDQEVLMKFISNVIDINTRDDSVLSDDIKLFIVNFLSESMLTEHRKASRKQDLQIWYSDLGEDEVKMFQKGQQLYLNARYDIPELICSLLEESFHQRYRLFNGVLELGICLIIGGNTEFQSRFIQAFKKDRKNTIFSNLSNIISETLKNIEFFYKSPSKTESEGRLVYPTVVRYELNMDYTEIQANRQERRSSCALVWKVFRFLQLLCENNNKEMKEYIQNQSDEEGRVKYTSINFIEEANKTLWEVMDILKGNLKEIRSFSDSIPKDDQERLFYNSFKTEVEENLCIIPLLIVEFLIEVCQIPSEKNQVYLCRTNFFQTVRRLEECLFELDDGKLIFGHQRFSDGITIRQQGVEVPFFFAIEKKIIVLIRSLLEPNDPFIKQILQKNFTNQAFRFLLVEAFHYGGIVDTEKLALVLSKYEVNAELLNIISLLVIKKCIGKDLSFLRENSSDDNCFITNDMLELLESRIRSIEVDLYGKTLTVYFPYNPLFDFLSNRTKDEIIYRRFESRTEKLRDMLNSRTIIYEEIKYEYEVHAKFINQKSLDKLFQTALYSSYLIIAMLTLFYSVTGLTLKLDTIEQSIVLYVSSVQFLMALTYIILWGIHQAPLAVSHLDAKIKNKKNNKPLSYLSKFVRALHLLKMVYLQNYKSRSVLAFFIISFMSAFLSVRFYAFNLFFLFAQIDVFKNIFAAILTNAKQLLVVCMFGLTFAFVFAFITLNSYLIPLYENQQVDIDIAKTSKQHCGTVFSCVVSLYTQHIIGEGSPGSQTTDYNRFLYDLLFISFFGIFFNNIVSGIMIDKFAELRDTRQKVENEIRNKCYICSADKSTLEKRSESFEVHLTEVHNIWNYYFYMYTLERIKGSNDFTGIEYWIQDKILKDDIEWFPYQRKYKENILEDKIASIEAKLDRLADRSVRDRDEAVVKREQ